MLESKNRRDEKNGQKLQPLVSYPSEPQVFGLSEFRAQTCPTNGPMIHPNLGSGLLTLTLVSESQFVWSSGHSD
jgi:hypothetical protein